MSDWPQTKHAIQTPVNGLKFLLQHLHKISANVFITLQDLQKSDTHLLFLSHIDHDIDAHHIYNNK